MQPHPTGRPGLLSIPGPGLTALGIRFARLSDRDHFDPPSWPEHAFLPNSAFPGWWQCDLDALSLADGVYEYELVADGNVVADPYAEAITRFGGYRGLFTIQEGKRISLPFRWDDELPAGVTLPQNNQIVIYEMPIRWMASSPNENSLVELVLQR